MLKSVGRLKTCRLNEFNAEASSRMSVLSVTFVLFIMLKSSLSNFGIRMAPVTRGMVPNEYGAPVGAPVQPTKITHGLLGSINALMFSIGWVAGLKLPLVYAELSSEVPGAWS